MKYVVGEGTAIESQASSQAGPLLQIPIVTAATFESQSLLTETPISLKKMSETPVPKDVIIVSPRRKLYIDHLIVHTMNNSNSATPQVTILPELYTN